MAQPDEILLIHEFWPDRYSEFTIGSQDHDYFAFSIEPWIIEVAFENLRI